MLLEISGEISPERMKGWSQSKNNTQLWMWLVIKARSDAVKSNIAQEGMSGPWIKANWKWSNGMGSVDIDILGIGELKWTGMGEFNSDDHYIYYCGQQSFRRNGVVLTVNKRVQNAVLGCNLTNDRMILVRFQGKPFNIMIIKPYDIDNFSSVQFSCSIMSNSLQPHVLQHIRPPCPSTTLGVHPNPGPSIRWCHPIISSSVVPSSSSPQSFPASGSF